MKALAALQPLEQVTTAEVSLGPEKLLFQLSALEVSVQRLDFAELCVPQAGEKQKMLEDAS